MIYLDLTNTNSDNLVFKKKTKIKNQTHFKKYARTYNSTNGNDKE